MEIEQSFTVAHAPARVWAFLGNPHAVAGCLTGAEVTKVDDDGVLEGRMTVRFGPIQASFAGSGRLSRDGASMTGRIEGQGLDQRSRSQCKGVIDYAVVEADGAATVTLKVDYTLAGSLAQFSRGGLVNDLAQRMTEDFAKALEAALDADAAPATSHSPSPRPEALNAGSLVARVFWRRIGAWLRRLFGG